MRQKIDSKKQQEVEGVYIGFGLSICPSVHPKGIGLRVTDSCILGLWVILIKELKS